MFQEYFLNLMYHFKFLFAALYRMILLHRVHEVPGTKMTMWNRNHQHQKVCQCQMSTIDRVSVKSLPAKNPSIISASSHSLMPVDPTCHTDIQHGADHAKLNAGLFVCICGYTTNSRQKLSSHISYMTLGKRYACPICKMKFVFLSGLRKHTKKSHKHSS